MTDRELMEQFQILAKAIGDVEAGISAKMATKEDLRELEVRLGIKMENEISDKIKSLFDGYKGALENQALLELANKTLAKRLSDVETRLAVLENKPA